MQPVKGCLNAVMHFHFTVNKSEFGYARVGLGEIGEGVL